MMENKISKTSEETYEKFLKESVFLESRMHGKHTYPNLLFSMYRQELTQAIEKAAKKLTLNIRNTAKEQNGHPYIGNINNEQAINLIIEVDHLPLNLRLFVDFLKEVREGAYSNKKVYDGKGNIIKTDILKQVDDEITKVRSPWRGEWFSDKYTKKQNEYYVTFYKINNKKIELVTEQLDKDTLMQDKTLRIDLDDWLKNSTIYGTPKKNVKNGELYYWSPVDNSVARFGANSGWANLYCDEDPSDSYSSLGVRAAKIKV